MRRLLFLFCAFLFPIMLMGQKINEKLTLLECEGAADRERCLYEKLGSLFEKKLDSPTIDSMMRMTKAVDTITLNLNFAVNEKGKVDNELFRSNFNKNRKIHQYIHSVLQDNLSFIMPLNECGKPVITLVQAICIRYLVEKDSVAGNVSLRLLPYVKEEKDGNLRGFDIEKVPVHKKCKKLNDNISLKKCFSKEVSRFVNKNFNTAILNTIDLPKCITRIYVTFIINKQGRVDRVASLASHPKLEEEAIRIVKKLPKVIPGIRRGKPVNVFYSLPIVIKIN